MAAIGRPAIRKVGTLGADFGSVSIALGNGSGGWILQVDFIKAQCTTGSDPHTQTDSELVGIEINKTWHPVSLCDLRARIARFYGPIQG